LEENTVMKKSGAMAVRAIVGLLLSGVARDQERLL